MYLSIQNYRIFATSYDNCLLISGQFSNKQFKCFQFPSDGSKVTITYDLARVRGNSCQVSITSLVERSGNAISSIALSSESCSYVPECFTQGKLKAKTSYFSFRFITIIEFETFFKSQVGRT